MSDNLRVLIVEDLPTDAEVMEYELQNAGFALCAKRVETKEAYIEALSAFLPDVILSDYSLPAFDGITALKLKLELAPDTPFIFVTGALGEELVVDLLKQGATDYVLKSRLYRLSVAVKRALREAKAETFAFSFVTEQSERVLGHPTAQWLLSRSLVRLGRMSAIGIPGGTHVEIKPAGLRFDGSELGNRWWCK